MKILITGAGGMLGSDLVSLLASKYEVAGAGLRPAPHLKIPFHVLNLADEKTAYNLMKTEKPKIILHAAAMTDVDRCETHRREALLGNLEATRQVTDAANHLEALVIFFSTDFVFDGRKSGPYEETDPPCPVSVYGESKYLAEKYLVLKGKRYLILRTSWLFGKQGNNFPKKILTQAESGKPLQVVTDQIGNPAYTKDLAEAVEKILESFTRKGIHGVNQIYHATNEGAVSRYEWAEWILKRRNYPTNLLSPVTADKLQRPASRPKNSVLSTEKIKKEFGIELRAWQEAMEDFLQEEFPLTSSSSEGLKAEKGMSE